MRMTILADGINLPLVAGMGLVVFGGLTLFVSLIESLVLRGMLRVPVRAGFWKVLLANLASTAAGWVVYAFNDQLLWAWGIRTVFDYAHYYLWGALGLIVLYYAKSVLVEGCVVATRRFAQRVGLLRRQLWKGMVVANIASYVFVGPLFYFATRPTFGNATIAKHPADVVTCQDPVYYLDNASRVCTIRADGTGQRVLGDRPVRRFLLSPDGSTFLCLGPDGDLWAQPVGSQSLVVMRHRSTSLGLNSADLSAGCDKVAFLASADPSSPADDSLRGQAFWSLRVFDLSNQALVAKTVVTARAALAPDISWDADDPNIIWSRQDDALAAFQLTDAGLVRVERTSPPHPVRNLRSYALWDWSSPTDVQGDLRLQVFPWSGGQFTVTRGDHDEVMDFHYHYGVLRAGLAGPWGGAFLSAPGQIVFQTRQLVCVANVSRRTVAVLVEGNYQRLASRSPIDTPSPSDYAQPASAPAPSASDPLPD